MDDAPQESPRKRLKTGVEKADTPVQDVPEDVDLKSDFTVHEMFLRIPIHLLDEVLDCLDLRQSARLSTVSSGWCSALDRKMVREKGMAVVEKPPETRIHSTLYALLVFVSPEQNDLFSLTKNRVRQLVLVGEFWTALRNPDPKMCKSITVETRSKYVETLSILDKLFICKAHFPELGPLSFMTELQSVVPVYLVHCFADLFACTVRFREFDPFRFGCPQFRDSSWVLKLIVPFVDVTWDYNDKREILKHVAFHADIDELVWPYPDEQLQWMLRTLSIVDRDTRHALIYADEVWKRDSQMVRMAYYTSNTPEAKQFAREVGAVFEGRELLPLDLAFLGRLLVFMNSNSAIPNFKPPPKAFPVDFTEPPPLQRSQ